MLVITCQLFNPQCLNFPGVNAWQTGTVSDVQYNADEWFQRACTQSADNVNIAFSVAHFLKNQSERSVNASLTPSERSVNTEWTQNARRPHSVWTLGGRRANTVQERSRHSLPESERRLDADQTRIERRPDTHWPGLTLDSEESHQSSRAGTNQRPNESEGGIYFR